MPNFTICLYFYGIYIARLKVVLVTVFVYVCVGSQLVAGRKLHGLNQSAPTLFQIYSYGFHLTLYPHYNRGCRQSPAQSPSSM